MRMLDLFSGIGGFALAAEWVWGDELEIVSFCEIDPFCQRVLKKHWPDVPIKKNIKNFDGKEIGKIDVLTGGFPCQPFSVAGRQRAQTDDRYLWPEMLKMVRETRPRWIVGENVTGIINLALDEVCSSLEMENYTVWPIIIPACAINAPHRRDRVWILSYTGCEYEQRGKIREIVSKGPKNRILPNNPERPNKNVTYTASNGWGSWGYSPGSNMESWLTKNKEQPRNRWSGKNRGSSWEHNWLEVATELCGMDDGLPAELDGLKLSKPAHRRERLKALGNAIVPQVAEVIFRAIKEIEK